MRRLAIGIDLGGTKTAAGLVDEDGRVVERAQHRTPADAGREAIVANAAELIRRVSANLDGVAAIGIGAAGVIDAASGTVLSATDALTAWAGTPLRAMLQDATGLPVVTINDVSAHAVGEAWCGASAKMQRSLVVAAGTGIGGALAVHGRVDPGANHLAGHIGHMPSEEAVGIACTCGREGHLEAIASGPALHAEYLRRGGDPAVRSMREVVARMHGGDTVAWAVVELGGAALGRTIGGVLNLLDPDVVVITGGLAHLGDPWWAALHRGIQQEAMDPVAGCPVVASTLADAAIIGAARCALSEAHDG